MNLKAGTHRLVALDLSLTSTGWASAHRDGIEVGIIRGQSHDIGRLDQILTQVKRVAQNAEAVVLEGYSFGSRGRGTISLGELGGVVRHWLWSDGVPFAEVPPSCLKKYATGKGNAPKDEVLVEAVKRLDYGGHSTDEADALWLLYMALDQYSDPRAIQAPKARRSVLERVSWPRLLRKVAA